MLLLYWWHIFIKKIWSTFQLQNMSIINATNVFLDQCNL
jgi:hypothetical protein